jgi:hypothetical protein
MMFRSWLGFPTYFKVFLFLLPTHFDSETVEYLDVDTRIFETELSPTICERGWFLACMILSSATCSHATMLQYATVMSCKPSFLSFGASAFSLDRVLLWQKNTAILRRIAGADAHTCLCFFFNPLPSSLTCPLQAEEHKGADAKLSKQLTS